MLVVDDCVVHGRITVAIDVTLTGIGEESPPAKQKISRLHWFYQRFPPPFKAPTLTRVKFISRTAIFASFLSSSRWPAGFSNFAGLFPIYGKANGGEMQLIN